MSDAYEDKDEGTDFSRTSASDIASRGVDKPGYYHFEVDDVKIDTDTRKEKNGNAFDVCPQITLVLAVAHSVDGQSPEGQKLFHRVDYLGKGGGPLEEWQVKKLARTLLAFGILEVTEDGRLVDPTTGKSAVAVNRYKDIIGMQIIGHVEHNEPREYTVKNGPNKGEKKTAPANYDVNWGNFFAVDDEAVADVPKNVELLATIGKVSAVTSSGGVPDDF